MLMKKLTSIPVLSGTEFPDFGIVIFIYIRISRRAVCNGYMALGTRGISIMFASGDGGVRAVHDDLSECSNNTFVPVFPASCPFVTSLGSTWGIAPEIAVNFTGGGFSNVFPRPAYQSVAV